MAINHKSKLVRFVSWVALSAMAAVPTAQPAFAGVGSDMAAYFDDMGAAANATGASAYQGQSAGYYTLGSAWSRFPQKTVTPANLQLPKVRAGCGGIDIFTGSFSFINTAEFVAMLKAIANNAIGFAFQLAIESISPQISGVIKDMQDIANKVNSFNINSCEAAAAAVGSIWPRIDKAEDRICQSIGTSAGRFADWAKSRRGCGNGGERASTNASNTDPALEAQKPTNKNYAWDMINNSPLKDESQEMRELVMNLVGTVIVRARTGGDDGPVSIDHIGPGDSAMLDALLDGTRPISIRGCADSAKCLSLTPKTVAALGPNALKPKIDGLIRQMTQKVHFDQPLTAAERALLGISSVPLYKIIVVNEAAGFQLSTNEVSTLSELVAVDTLDSIIQHTLDQAISGNSGNLNQADTDMLSEFRDQAFRSRARLADRLSRLQDKVNTTFQIVDRAMMIETTLQRKLAPGFSAALNFSRGLNASGVQ